MCLPSSRLLDSGAELILCWRQGEEEDDDDEEEAEEVMVPRVTSAPMASRVVERLWRVAVMWEETVPPTMVQS